MPPPPTDRDFDVVVHGASGFVGALTAAHLRDAAPDDVRIALSGRSLPRLEEVREGLGARAADWPLLEVDSLDDGDMARLATCTRVVATTVGPYDRLGLPLVRACARAGTHYADLTGEPSFMRRSIDEANDPATGSGARIVHSCGFDSVPSDLGVFLLADHAARAGLGTLGDTTLVLRAMRGGVSGGTIDSMRTQVDRAMEDRDARRLMADPFALSPARDREPDPGPQRDPVGVVVDEGLGGWLAPFVMGRVNTRVVRRSNALTGHEWGRDLRYRELVLGGRLPLGPVKAAAIAGGTAALAAAWVFPPTRAVLDRVLPDPGEGPSARTRERGFFRIDIHTTTTTGARLVCEIRVSGDPGYGATAVMLGQAVLALAGDPDLLPDRAGVLTPSTALGHELARRLRAAGHRYDVVPAD
jgi:short subunit dehydrogenase-like uncharacterized protein